jgi:hypothetical protein
VGAVAFATVFSLWLNTNVLSLQRVFRMRLTSTFGLRRTPGGLAAAPAEQQVRWSELAGYPIESVSSRARCSARRPRAGRTA